MNRQGPEADINWPMRACIFSLLGFALQNPRGVSRLFLAEKFITSISSVYITRSVPIDSLSDAKGKRKNLFSQTLIKNNNFAVDSLFFRT